MIDVETSLEPPVFEEEGDERPSTFVHVSISEDDGTSRSANVGVPGDGTDDGPVADALVSCIRAVASMRGPGLVAAVERRLQ